MQPNAVDVPSRYARLYHAAHALYMAGRWTCDAPVDAAALWTEMRDALGLAPGTATARGIGDDPEALS